MTYALNVHVGGRSGITSATDYSGKVLRCRIVKVFRNDYIFEAILDGVRRNVDGDDIRRGRNIFFTVTDGSSRKLIMKGVIEKIKWTSKNRCEISGKQSKRATENTNGQLHNQSLPTLSDLASTTLDNLINGTDWFANAKVWLDDGSDPTEDGRDVR